MNENSSVAGTVAADRSVAAFLLGAKSLFSFGPGDLESLDEEMDKAGQKDPEEEEGGTKYVFVTPQDGIGGGPERSNNNMDTRSVNGTQEDTSADDSTIRPKNLDVEMELGGSREDNDNSDADISGMESLNEGGSQGPVFGKNEEAIGIEKINMQTSTPTSGSQKERTAEPPQETLGEDNLPCPTAQEAGD